jgi:hypothetical protein
MVFSGQWCGREDGLEHPNPEETTGRTWMGWSLAPLSVGDPAPEYLDLRLGPRTIARHRAGFEAVEDRVGVFADVVLRPKVERKLHRLAVAPWEEALDVRFERDRSETDGSSVAEAARC